MSLHGNRLFFDPHCFQLIRYTGVGQSVFDGKFEEERMTDVWAWEQQGVHWGDKGTISLRSVWSYEDSLLVGYVKKRAYEADLWTFSESKFPKDLEVKSLSLSVVHFDCPLWCLWYIPYFEKFRILGMDLWLEYRLRMEPCIQFSLGGRTSRFMRSQ